MRQLNLHVGGMSCRRCVREVTARLRDIPGVETVSANPGNCLVRLSGSMELADVLAAFTGTTGSTFTGARVEDRPSVRRPRGGGQRIRSLRSRPP